MAATPAHRRARGFEPAARSLAATFGAAAARRGFATSRLLTHWDEIVGPAIAARCRPLKVTRGRAGQGGTLTVLTTGAHAPLLSMALPAVIARINAACGHAAVARISLTQTAAEGFAEAAARFEGAAPVGPETPPAAHLDRAAEVASGARDPDLAAALSRLTLRFLAENRKA